MRRRVSLFSLVGGLLLVICIQIAKSISQDFGRLAERNYIVAYYRFRCVWGRWPESTTELMSRAKPEYLKNISDLGKTFDLSLKQIPASNDRIILIFSGSYLMHFEQTKVLDFSCYDCKDFNSGFYYFMGPTKRP